MLFQLLSWDDEAVTFEVAHLDVQAQLNKNLQLSAFNAHGQKYNGLSGNLVPWWFAVSAVQ